jgi:hypothetical protein
MKSRIGIDMDHPKAMAMHLVCFFGEHVCPETRRI